MTPQETARRFLVSPGLVRKSELLRALRALHQSPCRREPASALGAWLLAALRDSETAAADELASLAGDSATVDDWPCSYDWS